ncbi:MAG: hypothetical protein J5881_03830 [Clostridia bacterium]|nr:hypothetical protein [Clostridia bacterium]
MDDKIAIDKNEEDEIKSQTIYNKNNALSRLEKSFDKHIDLLEYKKSDLLAYWINDFSNYHDNERFFDSSKLKKYKRGDIIKANLGFNIGRRIRGITLLCCNK